VGLWPPVADVKASSVEPATLDELRLTLSELTDSLRRVDDRLNQVERRGAAGAAPGSGHGSLQRLLEDQRKELCVLSGKQASLRERYVSDAGSCGVSEAMPDGVQTMCKRPANAGQVAIPGGVLTVCESVADLESRMAAAEAMPDCVSTQCERLANVGQEIMLDCAPAVCEQLPDLESRMAAASACQLGSLAAPAGMPAAQQAMPTLLISRSSASLGRASPSLNGSLPGAFVAAQKTLRADGAKRGGAISAGPPQGVAVVPAVQPPPGAPRGASVTISPRPAVLAQAPLAAEPPGQALAPVGGIRPRRLLAAPLLLLRP